MPTCCNTFFNLTTCESFRYATSFLTNGTSLNNSCWSGYCNRNKGECDLNQSNVGSFVEGVAKNNSRNNGYRHKIHKIFLIDCFALVITLVWKAVHSSAISQVTAKLLKKNTLQLTLAWEPLLLSVVSERNVLSIALSLRFLPPDHQVISQIPRCYYIFNLEITSE